ncbi:MAG: MarR family transcriptional regulator [Myxococcales bacterium]|nr:MarR family transcriptional regulator [Myxococcales bacterium]
MSARKEKEPVRPAEGIGEPLPPSRRLGRILDFMRIVWAVDHGLQSASKRMGAALGLTGPQRLVIRMAGKFPGISAGELAEILHVHKSSLTGVLQRLESRELLRRTIDPEDRRRATFNLTAKGRELDGLRAGTVEQAIRRALARVSDAEVDAARVVLVAIAEELLREDV